MSAPPQSSAVTATSSKKTRSTAKVVRKVTQHDISAADASKTIAPKPDIDPTIPAGHYMTYKGEKQHEELFLYSSTWQASQENTFERYTAENPLSLQSYNSSSDNQSIPIIVQATTDYLIIVLIDVVAKPDETNNIPDNHDTLPADATLDNTQSNSIPDQAPDTAGTNSSSSTSYNPISITISIYSRGETYNALVSGSSSSMSKFTPLLTFQPFGNCPVETDFIKLSAVNSTNSHVFITLALSQAVFIIPILLSLDTLQLTFDSTAMFSLSQQRPDIVCDNFQDIPSLDVTPQQTVSQPTDEQSLQQQQQQQQQQLSPQTNDEPNNNDTPDVSNASTDVDQTLPIPDPSSPPEPNSAPPVDQASNQQEINKKSQSTAFDILLPRLVESIHLLLVPIPASPSHFVDSSEIESPQNTLATQWHSSIYKFFALSTLPNQESQQHDTTVVDDADIAGQNDQNTTPPHTPPLSPRTLPTASIQTPHLATPHMRSNITVSATPGPLHQPTSEHQSHVALCLLLLTRDGGLWCQILCLNTSSQQDLIKSRPFSLLAQWGSFQSPVHHFAHHIVTNNTICLPIVTVHRSYILFIQTMSLLSVLSAHISAMLTDATAAVAPSNDSITVPAITTSDETTIPVTPSTSSTTIAKTYHIAPVGNQLRHDIMGTCFSPASLIQFAQQVTSIDTDQLTATNALTAPVLICSRPGRRLWVAHSFPAQIGDNFIINDEDGDRPQPQQEQEEQEQKNAVPSDDNNALVSLSSSHVTVRNTLKLTLPLSSMVVPGYFTTVRAPYAHNIVLSQSEDTSSSTTTATKLKMIGANQLVSPSFPISLQQEGAAAAAAAATETQSYGVPLHFHQLLSSSSLVVGITYGLGVTSPSPSNPTPTKTESEAAETASASYVGSCCVLALIDPQRVIVTELLHFGYIYAVTLQNNVVFVLHATSEHVPTNAQIDSSKLFVATTLLKPGSIGIALSVLTFLPQAQYLTTVQNVTGDIDPKLPNRLQNNKDSSESEQQQTGSNDITLSNPKLSSEQLSSYASSLNLTDPIQLLQLRYPIIRLPYTAPTKLVTTMIQTPFFNANLTGLQTQPNGTKIKLLYNIGKIAPVSSHALLNSTDSLAANSDTKTSILPFQLVDSSPLRHVTATKSSSPLFLLTSIFQLPGHSRSHPCFPVLIALHKRLLLAQSKLTISEATIASFTLEQCAKCLQELSVHKEEHLSVVKPLLTAIVLILLTTSSQALPETSQALATLSILNSTSPFSSLRLFRQVNTLDRTILDMFNEQIVKIETHKKWLDEKQVEAERQHLHQESLRREAELRAKLAEEEAQAKLEEEELRRKLELEREAVLRRQQQQEQLERERLEEEQRVLKEKEEFQKKLEQREQEREKKRAEKEALLAQKRKEKEEQHALKVLQAQALQQQRERAEREEKERLLREQHERELAALQASKEEEQWLTEQQQRDVRTEERYSYRAHLKVPIGGKKMSQKRLKIALINNLDIDGGDGEEGDDETLSIDPVTASASSDQQPSPSMTKKAKKAKKNVGKNDILSHAVKERQTRRQVEEEYLLQQQQQQQQQANAAAGTSVAASGSVSPVVAGSTTPGSSHAADSPLDALPFESQFVAPVVSHTHTDVLPTGADLDALGDLPLDASGKRSRATRYFNKLASVAVDVANSSTAGVLTDAVLTSTSAAAAAARTHGTTVIASAAQLRSANRGNVLLFTPPTVISGMIYGTCIDQVVSQLQAQQTNDESNSNTLDNNELVSSPNDAEPAGNYGAVYQPHDMVSVLAPSHPLSKLTSGVIHEEKPSPTTVRRGGMNVYYTWIWRVTNRYQDVFSVQNASELESLIGFDSALQQSDLRPEYTSMIGLLQHCYIEPSDQHQSQIVNDDEHHRSLVEIANSNDSNQPSLQHYVTFPIPATTYDISLSALPDSTTTRPLSFPELCAVFHVARRHALSACISSSRSVLPSAANTHSKNPIPALLTPRIAVSTSPWYVIALITSSIKTCRMRHFHRIFVLTMQSIIYCLTQQREQLNNLASVESFIAAANGDIDKLTKRPIKQPPTSPTARRSITATTNRDTTSSSLSYPIIQLLEDPIFLFTLTFARYFATFHDEHASLSSLFDLSTYQELVSIIILAPSRILPQDCSTFLPHPNSTTAFAFLLTLFCQIYPQFLLQEYYHAYIALQKPDYDNSKFKHQHEQLDRLSGSLSHNATARTTHPTLRLLSQSIIDRYVFVSGICHYFLIACTTPQFFEGLTAPTFLVNSPSHVNPNNAAHSRHGLLHMEEKPFSAPARRRQQLQKDNVSIPTNSQSNPLPASLQTQQHYIFPNNAFFSLLSPMFSFILTQLLAVSIPNHAVPSDFSFKPCIPPPTLSAQELRSFTSEQPILRSAGVYNPFWNSPCFHQPRSSNSSPSTLWHSIPLSSQLTMTAFNAFSTFCLATQSSFDLLSLTSLSTILPAPSPLIAAGSSLPPSLIPTAHSLNTPQLLPSDNLAQIVSSLRLSLATSLSSILPLYLPILYVAPSVPDHSLIYTATSTPNSSRYSPEVISSSSSSPCNVDSSWIVPFLRFVLFSLSASVHSSSEFSQLVEKCPPSFLFPTSTFSSTAPLASHPNDYSSLSFAHSLGADQPAQNIISHASCVLLLTLLRDAYKPITTSRYGIRSQLTHQSAPLYFSGTPIDDVLASSPSQGAVKTTAAASASGDISISWSRLVLLSSLPGFEENAKNTNSTSSLLPNSFAYNTITTAIAQLLLFTTLSGKFSLISLLQRALCLDPSPQSYFNESKRIMELYTNISSNNIDPQSYLMNTEHYINILGSETDDVVTKTTSNTFFAVYNAIPSVRFMSMLHLFLISYTVIQNIPQLVAASNHIGLQMEQYRTICSVQQQNSQHLGLPLSPHLLNILHQNSFISPPSSGNKITVDNQPQIVISFPFHSGLVLSSTKSQGTPTNDFATVVSLTFLTICQHLGPSQPLPLTLALLRYIEQILLPFRPTSSTTSSISQSLIATNSPTSPVVVVLRHNNEKNVADQTFSTPCVWHSVAPLLPAGLISLSQSPHLLDSSSSSAAAASQTTQFLPFSLSSLSFSLLRSIESNPQKSSSTQAIWHAVEALLHPFSPSSSAAASSSLPTQTSIPAPSISTSAPSSSSSSQSSSGTIHSSTLHSLVFDRHTASSHFQPNQSTSVLVPLSSSTPLTSSTTSPSSTSPSSLSSSLTVSSPSTNLAVVPALATPSRSFLLSAYQDIAETAQTLATTATCQMTHNLLLQSVGSARSAQDVQFISQYKSFMTNAISPSTNDVHSSVSRTATTSQQNDDDDDDNDDNDNDTTNVDRKQLCTSPEQPLSNESSNLHPIEPYTQQILPQSLFSYISPSTSQLLSSPKLHLNGALPICFSLARALCSRCNCPLTFSPQKISSSTSGKSAQFSKNRHANTAESKSVTIAIPLLSDGSTPVFSTYGCYVGKNLYHPSCLEQETWDGC